MRHLSQSATSLTISANPDEVWAESRPVGCEERTIWIVDAHRREKRFVVRADEKLTAFVELETAINQSEFRAISERARV